MNYTDQQLQIALAKMLPEKLVIETKSAHDNYTLEQSNVRWLYDSLQHQGRGLYVYDTEWHHVCWLVEKRLSLDDRDKYYYQLARITEQNRMATAAWTNCNASWQHRAIALAKVKGVEIV